MKRLMRVLLFFFLWLLCASSFAEAPQGEAVHTQKAFEAPAIIHPAEGWDVTDIALTFRWTRPYHAEDADNYQTTQLFQIQVASDASFSNLVLNHHQPGPISAYPEYQPTFDLWTQISWMPSDLLPAGSYYWRVRVADQSNQPWSAKVQFSINDDHAHVAPLRTLDAAHPLFSFDMFFGSGTEGLIARLPEIYASFPDSVRPYVALAIQNETIGMNSVVDDGFDGTLTDFLQPLADAGVPVVIKTGGPDKDFQGFADLAELEYIFRNQPNVIGLLEGETFWDFIDGEDFPEIRAQQVQWYRRSFQLAAKYGRLVIFGNGNDESFVWDRFLGNEDSLEGEAWMTPADITALAPYLVPCAKNNIPFGFYEAESVIGGAWLGGMVENWGMWSEGWAWGSIGYDGLFSAQRVGDAEDPDFSSMPYNLWIQMNLGALSRGATVFHFGGESSVVEWGEYDPATQTFDLGDEVLTASTAFWDMEGQELPALRQYIVPFLEAVVTQKLIPSREEMLQETRIAVRPGPPSEDSALDYGPYASLYRATVGLPGYVSIEQSPTEDGDDYYELTPNTCRRELLHDSGRYGLPPVLPFPMRSIADAEDIEIVTLEEIEGLQQAQDLFDSHYPDFSTGDAWVSRRGDRLYISNGHENTDTPQAFSTALPGGLGEISGSVLPHAYLLLKREANTVWVMANVDQKGSYSDDRTTRFALALSREPDFSSLSNRVTHAWDANTGIASLQLDHVEGAVSLELTLVPEPSSHWVMAAALMSLLLLRRKSVSVGR
jgi:hypothetical protein